MAKKGKREIHRLSARFVQTVSVPGYYPDGGGLYLQVAKNLSKSWVFLFTSPLPRPPNQKTGKVYPPGTPWTREMGLGSLHTIGLAEARASASDNRKMLLEGVDPIEARKAKLARAQLQRARSITFQTCAEMFINENKDTWSNAKHAEQWAATLKTYAYKDLGRLAVADIDEELVLSVLKPIWKKKPETASRLRGRIERILNFARASKFREGENPARWRGNLKDRLAPLPGRKQKKHQPALHHDEINAFMVELRKQQGLAATAMEFGILTGARTTEVIEARVSEFSLEQGLWTIPAERMKGRLEHQVPLSPRATEIVKAQLADNKTEYLFPAGGQNRPLSNQAMLELVRRMNQPLRWKDRKTGRGVVPHGFRATFRGWAAAKTNYPADMCELALAHVQDDKTIAAYQREDMVEKRRELMSDWQAYCEMRPKDWPAYCERKRDGKVVPLRRKEEVAA